MRQRRFCGILWNGIGNDILHRATLKANLMHATPLKLTTLPFFIACATGAFAQQTPENLVPSERFEVNDRRPDFGLTWESPIRFQTLGDFDEHQAFKIAARLSEATRVAGVKFSISGGIEQWFASSNARSESNYIVLLPKANDEVGFKIVDERPKWESETWGSKNSFLNAVQDGKLNLGFPGCYGRMLTSPSGGIVGYVAAFVHELSERALDDCLSLLVPSSFGLNPNVTRYQFSSAIDVAPMLVDDSEVYLELSVKNACRDQHGSVAMSCVQNTIREVWKSHGERH